jgi:hypothetical protein
MWINCANRVTPPNTGEDKSDVTIPITAKTIYTLDGKQSVLNAAEKFIIYLKYIITIDSTNATI